MLCKECRYLFNVTKDVKSKQLGGKINAALNNIFEKYNSTDSTINKTITEEDLKKIKGKDLLDDDRFDIMTKKDQRKLISTIKAVDKNFFVEEKETKEDTVDNQEFVIGNNPVYFICKFCKNYEKIKPQTCIYTKNFGGENAIEVDNYTYSIYDHTLPRTRNYICKNSKCETLKNDAIKEAVLTKNSLEQIVYICTSCSTHWIESI